MMRRLVVTDEWHNVRADRFLAHVLPRSLVHKQLRLGRIKLAHDAPPLTHSDRVVRDQVLLVPDALFDDVQRPAPREPTAQELEATQKMILFSNRDLVAIDKPRGLASQAGVGVRHRHVAAALFPALRRILGDAESPRIVHRLDRDASGVLVLARSRPAAAALSAALVEHRWHKEYVALVRGAPPQGAGSIRNQLLKHNVATARDAHTDYRVLDARGDVSLLSLIPHTGRQHQLRIHCAQSLRTPILGDTKYGTPDLESGEACLYLHAHRLRLSLSAHQEIEIEAPIPPEFRERLSKH
jgi:23S rRNA pseudouridine955/2504/2580 synthase